MWGSLYVQEKLTQFRLEETERLRKQRGLGEVETDSRAGAEPARVTEARPRRVRRRWLLPLHAAGHALVRLGTLLEDWSHTTLRDPGLRPEPEE